MTENSKRTEAVFPRGETASGTTLTRHIARLGAVFDAAPIGVGVWSVEGELVHANPVLCDLLGRTRTELVGERFEFFIEPADATGIRKLLEDLWEGSRNFFDCDFRCRQPNGGDLWLRTHVLAVYGPGGRPEYYMSQIFNFASSRAHDHHEDRLAAASPAMLWLSDETGIPRTGNARSFEFLGVPESSGELHTSLFDTIHPDDYAVHRDELLASIDKHEAFSLTARSRRADGQWRWLHHRTRPLFGDDGEFEGYAGVSLDITEEERHRRRLEDVRRLFENVTEAGPLAVLRTDAVGRVVYANGRLANLLDNPEIHLNGLGWRSVLIPEHVEEVTRLGAIAVETSEPFVLRVRAHDSSIPADRVDSGMEGKYWLELRVAPVFTVDRAHDGFVATIADITAEVAAGERADQLARVLDAGTDYLMIVERNGAISYANQAAEEALGVHASSRDQLRFLMDVLDADSFTFFHEVVEQELFEARRWKGELNMRGEDGRDIPVSALVLAHANELGRIETISVVARDISDLKQAQFRMHQLATHDYLTGLPNRVLLYDHLDRALDRHRRYGQSVALLYLDLDRFKPINDSLGHHVGDLVLVALSDRIHSVMRETDTPARIGGDEFAVLVEGFDGMETLEHVAARLIDVISQPIAVEGVIVTVGVSIGMVAADESTRDADDLLARADRAMYAAKSAGRGRFVFADESMAHVRDSNPDRVTRSFTDAAAVDAAWAGRVTPRTDVETTMEVELGVEPSLPTGVDRRAAAKAAGAAQDVEAVLALVVNDFAETRSTDPGPTGARPGVAPADDPIAGAAVAAGAAAATDPAPASIQDEGEAPTPAPARGPGRPPATAVSHVEVVVPDEVEPTPVVISRVASPAPAPAPAPAVAEKVAAHDPADVDDVEHQDDGDDLDDDEIVTPWFLSVIEDDEGEPATPGPGHDQGPAGPTGTAEPNPPSG